MPSSGGPPRVSAVLSLRDPNPAHLAWTLDSLAEQTRPPDEVIAVDASPEPVDVNHEELNTKVYNQPDMGIGDAREFGLEKASGEYIVEMDEDAILVADNYIQRGMEELSRDRVAGAGGVLLPLTEKPTAKLVAALDRVNPSDLGTHYLIYPRALCMAGGEEGCYPVPGRGEDRTVRERLRQFGDISRMHDQPVMKDVPTTRQENGLKTIGASILAGVATSFATSLIRDALADVQEGALAELEE